MSHTRKPFLLWITLVLLLAACNAPLPAPTATPTHPPPGPPEPDNSEAQIATAPSAALPEAGLLPTDTPKESLQLASPVPPLVTVESYTVTAKVNANCRTGPLTIFNQYGFLLTGETATALGRLADSSWFKVQLLNKAEACWISASLLSYSFNAADLPVLASPPTPTPALGSISGILWHEICQFTGGDGGEPVVLGQGCVQYGPGPGDFGPNQVKDGFETGWAGVTMRLGAGACPSTGMATAVTNANGAYSFNGLAAGIYCVSYNPLGDGNDSILIPGGPTYPIRGSGGERQTVDLDPGENAASVNFGWAWQFFN